MIIWLPFSVISLLLAYLADPKNKLTKQNNFFQVLLSVWLAWFVSFGGGAMTDQAGYMIAYKSLGNNELYSLGEILKFHIYALMGDRKATEIGYVFLNILFNKLGLSYIGFSFFFSIITNSLLISFIYRFRYPVFIILVFITSSFLTQQANLVRQMMVVSIFLFSTKYIVERNIFKYFAAIFIASLFHASSLILLPVYFIANRNYPKFIFLAIWVFTLVINLDPRQFGFIETVQSWKIWYYNMYLNKDEGVGTDTGFDWRLNVVLFLFLVFKNPNWKKELNSIMIFNLFFLGVILLNFRVVSDWFFRVSLYFIITYIILVPIIVENIVNSNAGRRLNFRLVGKYLVFLIILYHSYLLFAFSFKPIGTGKTLGMKMYTISEMFK